jgi:hypothetical protein
MIMGSPSFARNALGYQNTFGGDIRMDRDMPAVERSKISLISDMTFLAQ